MNDYGQITTLFSLSSGSLVLEIIYLINYCRLKKAEKVLAIKLLAVLCFANLLLTIPNMTIYLYMIVDASYVLSNNSALCQFEGLYFDILQFSLYAIIFTIEFSTYRFVIIEKKLSIKQPIKFMVIYVILIPFLTGLV